eukprot:1160460-Pelagomonas_calceolata.AAC.7
MKAPFLLALQFGTVDVFRISTAAYHGRATCDDTHTHSHTLAHLQLHGAVELSAFINAGSRCGDLSAPGRTLILNKESMGFEGRGHDEARTPAIWDPYAATVGVKGRQLDGWQA